MMAEESAQDGNTPSVERILLSALALLAADRDGGVEEVAARRTEVVLADVGFTTQEIAALTGRNREAVRSTLRRAQARGLPGDGTDR